MAPFTLKHRFKTRVDLTPYLFILPAALLYVLFNIGPSIAAVVLSFFKWNLLTPTSEFVGFKQYSYILGDKLFWNALSHNTIYLVLGLVVPTVIGLTLALLIMEVRKGRVVYRSLNFLPAIFSGVVIAYVWKWIYDPLVGVLNQALNGIGLSFLAMSWLGDARIALYSTFVPYAWGWYGYTMVIYLAGLQAIDKDLFDAAIVDGANFFQRTFYITIPLLRDVTTFVLTLGILSSMTVFSTIFVLTHGGPYYATEVMGTYVFAAIGNLQLGWATAAATINAFIVMTLTLLFLRRRERE